MDNQQDAREGVTLDVMAEMIELPNGCYARNYIGVWAVYDDRHQRVAILRGADEARALGAALACPVDRQGDGAVQKACAMLGIPDAGGEQRDRVRQLLESFGAPTPLAPAGLLEAVRARLHRFVQRHRNGTPNCCPDTCPVNATPNTGVAGPDDLTLGDLRALNAALSAQAGAAPGVAVEGDFPATEDASLSGQTGGAVPAGDLRPGLREAIDCLSDELKTLTDTKERGALMGLLGVLYARLASQPGGGPVAAGDAGIYIASKAIHGPRWRNLRESGFPIISTWIDEAEAGRTSDWQDLWDRCATEPAKAAVTILYREEGEELKGALVEVGSALSHGRWVIVVGPVPHTWAKHRRVVQAPNMVGALARALLEVQAVRKSAAALGASSGGEGGRG